MSDANDYNSIFRTRENQDLFSRCDSSQLFNDRHCEDLFTPRGNELASLPALQLIEARPSDHIFMSTDVSRLASNVIWRLEHNTAYGVPTDADISRGSDGCLDSIHFPENNQFMRISYDDRAKGKVGSIDMDGKVATFSYDGDQLQSISFSGGRESTPAITFMANDYPGIAFQAGRKMPADQTTLAAAVYNHLRKDQHSLER